MKSEVRLFADDLILYREMKTPADCDALQQDINSLCKWESTWQMKFNTSKCFIMHMTHQKRFTPHHYKMRNSILESVCHHPYLGVEISDKLTWARHIDQSDGQQSKQHPELTETQPVELLATYKGNCVQNLSQTKT